MKRIELREHGRLAPVTGDREPPPATVGVAARLYERLRRFDEAQARTDASIFTWYATYAKAAQWVGVVQIDGLQLELLPKIHPTGDLEPAADARKALVTMLAYAGDVPLRIRDLASLLERNADLGEVLAAVFADRLLQELVRGPERAYVVRRENLPCFRGKLVVRKHIALNAAHRERFLCDHDELVADTPLNRVLRAACGLLSATMRSSRTIDLLERCLVVLEDVSDVVVTRELLAGVVLTRQSQRFEPLLQFCRMLFAGRAPTSQAGATNTFSLLFDMNVVFERFVAGFVAREVMPLLPGWKARTQSRGHTRHLLHDGNRGVLRLKPDLLLERPDGSLVVVDTKWKRLIPGRERASISQADLYQLYAYSQRYKATRSILLYPFVDGVSEHVFNVLGDGDKPADSRIEVAFVHVDGLGCEKRRKKLAATLAVRLAGTLGLP